MRSLSSRQLTILPPTSDVDPAVSNGIAEQKVGNYWPDR